MPSGYGDIDKKQSGDANIMKLQEGANKVRPLDNTVAGWKQHGIEHPSDPEQFASVVCPGPRTCPLDRKPVDAKGKARFPISRRFAANVWDYTTNSVKVLVAGPSVFDKFKAAAQVGIQPKDCDWIIVKTGKGIQTDYDVINAGAGPFTAGNVTEDQLHDVTKYEQPASPEAIFEILEKFGINYDALEIPSYDYDDGLAFIMPYGKHKGETIEHLTATDLDYAKYIHGSKLEQGAFGDPVFLALQVVFENMDIAPPLDEAVNLLPEPTQTPAPATSPGTTPAGAGHPGDQSLPDAKVTTVPEGMTKMIAPTGVEAILPNAVVDIMLAQGYKLPEPAAAAEPDSLSVMVLATGETMKLPRAAALVMIETGAASLVSEEAKPAPPALPLPDEMVDIEVAGNAMKLPFAQAAQIVDAGSGSFIDISLSAVYQSHKDKAAAQPDPSQTIASASASTPAAATPSSEPDPEKPFVCDECGARYKAQGALTQHKNREHKATEVQPSAVPAAANGGGSLADQIKADITGSHFVTNYNDLIKIMKEETGTANFVDMSEEQLVKLSARIKQEIAAHKDKASS